MGGGERHGRANEGGRFCRRCRLIANGAGDVPALVGGQELAASLPVTMIAVPLARLAAFSANGRKGRPVEDHGPIDPLAALAVEAAVVDRGGEVEDRVAGGREAQGR
jgi:hypothetical protein